MVLQTLEIVISVLFDIFFLTLAVWIYDISFLKLKQELLIVGVKHLLINILTLNVLNEFDNI